MEKKLEHDMNTGIVQGFMGIRVSVSEGSLFGRSMIRIIVFRGLSCGPVYGSPYMGVSQN